MRYSAPMHDDDTRIDPHSIKALYRRPGFMLRRAHQIAVSVFLTEAADLGVTTTQYGVLFLLARRGGLDQASVARLLGLDRSTTALVVRKLEIRGLIGRSIDSADRRRHSLVLTAEGKRILALLAEPALTARDRLLEPLAPDERDMLLSLLGKLIDAFNATARVPLLADDTELTEP
jgi:DNA-binding MarR family transcriptional regulator